MSGRGTAGRGRAKTAGLALLVLLAGGYAALSVGWVGPQLLERICPVQIVPDPAGALTPAELVAALDAPAGDWAAAEMRLAALPRIRRAQVRFIWPGRLELRVAERQAVALILAPDNAALEVAADGMLMTPRGALPADLPLLGWEPTAAVGPVHVGQFLAVRGAPDLLMTLAGLRDDHPQLWDGVSGARLHADGTYELFWNDVPTVVWGRGRLSPVRLRAWAGIMADLRRRGEKDVVVDLRYQEQILVRLPEAAAGGSGAVG